MDKDRSVLCNFKVWPRMALIFLKCLVHLKRVPSCLWVEYSIWVIRLRYLVKFLIYTCWLLINLYHQARHFFSGVLLNNFPALCAYCPLKKQKTSWLSCLFIGLFRSINHIQRSYWKASTCLLSFHNSYV